METKDLLTFAAVFSAIGMLIGAVIASCVLRRDIRRAEINGWKDAIKYLKDTKRLN